MYVQDYKGGPFGTKKADKKKQNENRAKYIFWIKYKRCKIIFGT
jgi:hypothetical protein